MLMPLQQQKQLGPVHAYRSTRETHRAQIRSMRTSIYCLCEWESMPRTVLENGAGTQKAWKKHGRKEAQAASSSGLQHQVGN